MIGRFSDNPDHYSETVKGVGSITTGQEYEYCVIEVSPETYATEKFQRWVTEVLYTRISFHRNSEIPAVEIKIVW